MYGLDQPYVTHASLAMSVHRPPGAQFYLQRLCAKLTFRQLHSVLGPGNGIDHLTDVAPTAKKACDLVWHLGKQSPQRLRLQWGLVSSKVTKQQLVEFCQEAHVPLHGASTKQNIVDMLMGLDVFDLKALPEKPAPVTHRLVQSLKKAALLRLQGKSSSSSSASRASAHVDAASSVASPPRREHHKLKKHCKRLVRAATKLVIRSTGFQQTLHDVRMSVAAACKAASTRLTFDVDSAAAVAVVDKVVFKILRKRGDDAEAMAARPPVVFAFAALDATKQQPENNSK